MKKIVTFLCCFVLGIVPALAQLDEDTEVYESEFTYGINFNTNAGLIGGIMLKNARKITPNMYHHFYLELVNVKHPKETRYTIPTGNLITLFKQNYLFALRPKYGREFVLFRKAPDEGVQINLILAGGPSFGFTKPYYVQVQPLGSTEILSIPYTAEVKPLNSIVGSGGFTEGFDQLKVNLGANIKAGASFELGTFQSSVTGFEIGFMVEAYTKKIPIMAFAENKSVFTSGYVNIFFGSRR